jgi:TrmH family RNA methyltransferase
MIPLDKLARLPRHQRLRKAEKILASAELQLIAGQFAAGQLTTGQFSTGRLVTGPPAGTGSAAAGQERAASPASSASPISPVYLAELLALLAGDGEFSTPEREVLEKAAQVQAQAQDRAQAPEPSALRRAVNTARHIVLSATGRQPADWDLLDAGGILDGARRRVFPGMEVYLEDIRSPFNVGAMFRAAESFGVEKLWLSPLCADPRHRRALRTAMGCVDILRWEREDLEQVPGLRGRNGGEPLPCFALETGGTDIRNFSFPPRGILIVGSEELGLSSGALDRAGASLGRLSIGTYGVKGSLNVSVAFGIALQRWAEVLAAG